MELPSVGWQRCGRALCVVLALVANLFATGIPLVHALAHEVGHRQADAHGHADGDHHGTSSPEGEHDEIHPAALHDECLVVPRAGLDVAVAPIAETCIEPIALVATEAPFLVASALHSRAPPRTTLARAPPFV